MLASVLREQECRVRLAGGSQHVLQYHFLQMIRGCWVPLVPSYEHTIAVVRQFVYNGIFIIDSSDTNSEPICTASNLALSL